jgi:hypothetical protein
MQYYIKLANLAYLIKQEQHLTNAAKIVANDRLSIFYTWSTNMVE